MSRLLFENSKFALGFAGVVVVGAGIFAGVSGSTDFARAPGDQSSENAQAEAPAQPSPTATPKPMAEQPQIADFAPDEDLIDSAEGFDPTPRESYELAEAQAPEPDDGESAGKPRSASAGSNSRNTASKGLPTDIRPVKRTYSKGKSIPTKVKNPNRQSGGRPIKAHH